MSGYSVAPLDNLIEKFESLPGIGKKTAQRLSYYVLTLPKDRAEAFSRAILEAHEKIRYCKVCRNLTDSDLCGVCKDDSREKSVICVVEDTKDVVALEKIGEFNALYHVLHGSLSPLNGIGPDQLYIKELLARINKGNISEVIMATNPTVEGEATAMYISKLIKPLNIKVTRLAYGIPVGADLEYADEITLSRALIGRSEM
ncbi:MAG: Recombination protein RecR [Eubacteriales bacterium SKADARSKE-1]|nr:Recombination protein RecR [Eubacteriales bacterium SKADARSKE-1]